jgi:integrase
MSGHIRRRGENCWELKFDTGRDTAGKRQSQYHSFKGTKKDAKQKLASLIAAVGEGSYTEPTKTTVGEFVRGRIAQWEAAQTLSPRTAQRYWQLFQNQIVPHIGAKLLQRLARLDVEAWHTALRNTELAARTIGHAHRVLGKALNDAERDGLIMKNACKLQRAPKVAEREMIIVQDVPGFVEKVRGTRLFVPVLLAITTGMRLGEILALRRKYVDLDRGVVEVRAALEETKAHGIQFKMPKSRAGRRDITLPHITVEALREHLRQDLETRMRLGLGRPSEDALVFGDLEGQPLRPGSMSNEWGKLANQLGLPEITFHALRHSHASQLIERGVDIVTISQRLGHAKPDITLRIYAHMFKMDDSKAAAAVNAALAG